MNFGVRYGSANVAAVWFQKSSRHTVPLPGAWGWEAELQCVLLCEAVL